MRALVTTFAEVAGAALLCLGVSLVSVPAALICGGVLLVIGGALAA